MSLYLGDIRVSPTIEKDYLGIPLEVSAQGVLQKPKTSFTWKSQGNIIKENTFMWAFSDCTGLTNADMSSITTVKGDNAMTRMFNNCTNLISVDLSNLELVDINYNDNKLALARVFQGCTSLTNVNLSSLEHLYSTMQNAFQGCTSLTTQTFPSLRAITSTGLANAFQNCTSLTTLSFPSLVISGISNNSFTDMLSGVTDCTVHFPSNLQSTMSSWTSVTSGFSGTNTTILFDLPATT